MLSVSLKNQLLSVAQRCYYLP